VVQGSSSISSADLFGKPANNSDLDISAADLINRISFQVAYFTCSSLSFQHLFSGTVLCNFQNSSDNES
jgi:hypothetical protein